MKKLSLTELWVKYYRVFFIFFVVGLVFLSWFFLRPQVKQVFEAKKDLDQEKRRLTSLRAKLADLENLNEFELSERTNVSLQAIPEKKNIIGLIANLRSQLGEKGLIMENLQVSSGELPATSSAQQGLGEFNFKLAIRGTLEAVLDFFAKAEKSLPLVSFREVKIEVGEEEANTSFILESYFLSLPGVLGAIDAPVPKLTSGEEKVLQEIAQYSFFSPVSFPPAQGKTNPFSF